MKIKYLIWRIAQLDKLINKLERKRWKLAKQLEGEYAEDMFGDM
jgi:hypothetical protein